jgi:uncharacterized lipoprotein NlpE involved in copper resistance
MVIIGMISYPPESANEMGKRFLESSAIPSYMTLKGPFVYSEVGGGIKILALYDVDQSKLREAEEVVLNRYAKYFGVPGFSYSVQPWLEIKEALKMIGLA